MILKDPRFKTPAWNATIWRYMSFEKFLDLMFSQTLYFSNLSMLTDKREAEIPQKNFHLLRKKFIDDYGSEKLGDQKFFEFYIDIKHRIKSSFVNCWIISPDESYALWKIYLSGGKTGVAIKTNTTNLKKSIKSVDKSENIYFGRVGYADFITKEINLATLITTKRKAYTYENECRLVITKEPEYKKSYNGKELNIKDGYRINVDTDRLIQKLYISPFADKIFKTSFRLIIKKLFPSLMPKIEFSLIKDQ